MKKINELITEFDKLIKNQGSFQEKYEILEILKESTLFKTMLVKNKKTNIRYIAKAILNEDQIYIQDMEIISKRSFLRRGSPPDKRRT